MPHKLFMILLGCKPAGRNTEQHDIFFGIAEQLKDLIPTIKASWKASGKIHIDAFREITNVDGHKITVAKKYVKAAPTLGLFFINLGGYKPNCFDEFHYKMLTVSASKTEAIHKAKQSAFYLHTGFGKIATSHIDDKYGIDVDDLFDISDILSTIEKEKFSIKISNTKKENLQEDEIQLGYFKLDSFL